MEQGSVRAKPVERHTGCQAASSGRLEQTCGKLTIFLKPNLNQVESPKHQGLLYPENGPFETSGLPNDQKCRMLVLTDVGVSDLDKLVF